MAAKDSDHENNLFDWLLARGGEAVEDLLTRPHITDRLGKAVRGAAKARGTVDKNVETMLHLLNLPSRSDYDKLRMKLEHLQGSVINLGMKLDQLLAATQPRPKRPKR